MINMEIMNRQRRDTPFPLQKGIKWHETNFIIRGYYDGSHTYKNLGQYLIHIEEEK